MRVAKATLPPTRPLEPDFVCLKINKNWIPVFMAALHRFEWGASWKEGTDLDRAEQDIFTLYHALINANGDCQGENCYDYKPDVGFIEWFPNNPFAQPDLITAGYNAPAWYVANQTTRTVMTDISRFPAGSLPSIIPSSGLPRLRVHVNGPATVRLNMFSIVAGSMAQVTRDDNPLTVEYVDLNKDVLSVPPETDEDVIIEYEFPTGPHHMDVIIVSMVNDEIPFVYHGGGIKSIEICGDDAVLQPRFKFENCSMYVSWNGGQSWEIVPGWDTYAPTCFTGPAGQDGEDGEDAVPFDLRFNNCNLEYSRDSAQTWDVLPGWADWLTCIPEGETYDLRMQDGILQWSKDGGQDWANVEGWTQSIQQVVNEKDRCLNAWGATFGLKYLTMAFTGHMFSSSTIGEYNDAVYLEWQSRFPLNAPPSQLLEDFVFFTWNAGDHGDLHNAIGTETNASELAARIFTVMPSGEWCDDNLALFSSYFQCEDTPAWIAAIISLVDCLFAGPLEYDKIHARALMFQYRDFGTCQPCELTEINPCASGLKCHYFDFGNLPEGWNATSGEWTASGLKTVPYQGSVRMAQMSIGLSSYSAQWQSLFIRVMWDGAVNGEFWVYQVIGGQLVELAHLSQEQASETVVSLSPDTTQLQVRATTGGGDCYIQSAMLSYEAVLPLWSENCSQG